MSGLPEATDENFENQVINATLPVVVDFWAEWCAPCRAISPILEDLAKTYAEKVKIVAVNVDKSPEVTAKYGVRGIPTLLFVKGGQVNISKVGALSKNELVELIDDLVEA